MSAGDAASVAGAAAAMPGPTAARTSTDATAGHAAAVMRYMSASLARCGVRRGSKSKPARPPAVEPIPRLSPTLRLARVTTRPRRSGRRPRLDDVVEDEPAVLHAVGAVLGQRGVPVLVDRVSAEHRIAVLDVEERVDHRLALVAPLARVVDGQQRHLHRLVAVDRIGRGLAAVALL